MTENKENTSLKLGIYRHYKGMLHQVIGLARHTENGELLVVYQNLFEDFGLRVRPYEMFIENVTIANKTTSRFTFVKELYSKAPPIEATGGYKPSLGCTENLETSTCAGLSLNTELNEG
jgi:hypothetical protein